MSVHYFFGRNAGIREQQAGWGSPHLPDRQHTAGSKDWPIVGNIAKVFAPVFVAIDEKNMDPRFPSATSFGAASQAGYAVQENSVMGKAAHLIHFHTSISYIYPVHLIQLDHPFLPLDLLAKIVHWYAYLSFSTRECLI